MLRIKLGGSNRVYSNEWAGRQAGGDLWKLRDLGLVMRSIDRYGGSVYQSVQV